MKREDFFPEEEVLGEDLARLEDSAGQAIKERNRDFFVNGILHFPGRIVNNGVETDLSTNEFPITFVPSSNLINVGTGIAYDRLGERIISPALVAYDSGNPTSVDVEGNPTPDSTGNQNIPLVNGDSYVYIDYLETIDTSVFFPDPITGQRRYTKITDGYKITTSTVAHNDPAPTPPTTESVFLGMVYVLSGVVQTIDLSNRVFSTLDQRKVQIQVDVSDQTVTYTDGTVASLKEHINALGHGTPSPDNPHAMSIEDVDGLVDALTEPNNIIYQNETHTNGLVPDPTTSLVLIPTVESSLKPSIINGTPPGTPISTLAVINLRKLLLTEAVYVHGVRTNDIINPTYTGGSGDTYVAFTSSDLANTYMIYLQESAGVITASKTTTSSFISTDLSKFPVCSVSWNGTILSSLIDLRKFGTLSNRNIQDGTIDVSTKLAPGTILPASNFSDVSHGIRGGGSLHAVATSSTAGFMAATDKVKLDSLTGLTEITDTQHGARSNRPLSGSVANSNLSHSLATGSGQPGFSDNNFTDSLLTKLNNITAGAKKVFVMVATVGLVNPPENSAQTSVGQVDLTTGISTGFQQIAFLGGVVFPAGISVVAIATLANYNRSIASNAGGGTSACVGNAPSPVFGAATGSSSGTWYSTVLTSNSVGSNGSGGGSFIFIGIQ